MKCLLATIVAVCWSTVLPAGGTTISVVSVFEPLSLHGTDVDGDITETGEALQAAVVSRPMALTGAFPEDLVEAVRTPHLIPSNNPNFQVPEANLLILCGICLSAEATDAELLINIDISKLVIPEEVDLTSRQVVKLILVAIRKTLEVYQDGQTDSLKVKIVIDGAVAEKATLKELDTEFELSGVSGSR
ncbi:MAG: hypothetical protein K9M97_13165 [Akkermansiaceae bacterium]|nr:hypothetical protein [Akkermansiaceae bacterium]